LVLAVQRTSPREQINTVTAYAASGFYHSLLVVAVVMMVVRLLTGRDIANQQTGQRLAEGIHTR